MRISIDRESEVRLSKITEEQGSKSKLEVAEGDAAKEGEVRVGSALKE